MSGHLIELKEIEKKYPVGENTVFALKKVSFTVDPGEFVSVMGPSGSGKSTLLYILGCMESPTSGRYLLGGVDVGYAGDRRLSGLRSKSIGFVFQLYNLIPHLDLVENVALPFLYIRDGNGRARRKAMEALDKVGLSGRHRHRPAQLSGGEMQRAAIARALVTDPKLILADEPTGNLDSKTGGRILDLIGSLHAEGTTVIMVTHDPAVAGRAERTIRIRDGSLCAGISHTH